MRSFTKQATALIMFAIIIQGYGCDSPVSQIGGISGSILSEGRPLPIGTIVSFYLVNRDESFVTQVDDVGRYRYKPAPNVPVTLGQYKLVVTLPEPEMVTLANGEQIPDPNFNQDYFRIAQKYQSLESTPLVVECGEREVVYDIDLTDAK